MLKDLELEIEKNNFEQVSQIIFKNDFSYLDDSAGLWSFIAKQSLIPDRGDRLQSVINEGYIHATMFQDLCVRQVALHRRTGIKVESEPLNINSKLTWKIGRALEEHNRNELMAHIGKSAIVGEWHCHCKTNPKKIIHKYDTTKYGNDEPCRYCGHTPDIYQEPTILLDDFHAVCNPDLVFFNKNGYAVNFELKSIKEGGDGSQLKGFKDLDSPHPSNLQQALMQHLFMAMAGINVDNYVIVNYTSKAHTGFKNPPWKEYAEKISDHKLIYNHNKKLLEKGKIVKTMTLDGVVEKIYDTGYGLPDGNYDGKQCKGCQMKVLCTIMRPSKS